jgi:hypothetical protein
MKKKMLVAMLAGISMLVLADSTFAAPVNIVSARPADFHKAGKHQFYLWCGNGHDRIVYQDGDSGRDARARLNLASGACRAVWQGRVGA